MANCAWIIYLAFILGSVTISIVISSRTKKLGDILSAIFTVTVPIATMVFVCVSTEIGLSKLLMFVATIACMPILLSIYAIIPLIQDAVPSVISLFSFNGSLELEFLLSHIRIGSVEGILLLVSHVMLTALFLTNSWRILKTSRFSV